MKCIVGDIVFFVNIFRIRFQKTGGSTSGFLLPPPPKPPVLLPHCSSAPSSLLTLPPPPPPPSLILSNSVDPKSLSENLNSSTGESTLQDQNVKDLTIFSFFIHARSLY